MRGGQDLWGGGVLFGAVVFLRHLGSGWLGHGEFWAHPRLERPAQACQTAATMPIAHPIRAMLEKLPRSSATWHVAYALVDPELTNGAVRSALSCTQGDGLLRADAMLEGAATEAAWCKLLVRAMQSAPSGGRAMVPKVLKVIDPALAALLQPIVSPLKVKVEQVDGPLATVSLVDAWSAPATPNPPTLFQERALWDELFELHLIHLVGDANSDLTFAMTTDIVGWESPMVLWSAVSPDADRDNDGEDLFIFPTAQDADNFLHDNSAGSDTNQRCLRIFFHDPHGCGGQAWQRALVRKLKHLHCHVPVLAKVEPGPQDPREQLDATETAVVQLVSQSLRAWAALHRVGPCASSPMPDKPVPPLEEVLAVPGTTATIVWHSGATDSQAIAKIIWSWPVVVAFEVIDDEAYFAVMVPPEAAKGAAAVLDAFVALRLRRCADSPDDFELLGMLSVGERELITVLPNMPVPSADWLDTAERDVWLIDVVVYKVEDLTVQPPSMPRRVETSRFMPVAVEL